MGATQSILKQIWCHLDASCKKGIETEIENGFIRSIKGDNKKWQTFKQSNYWWYEQSSGAIMKGTRLALIVRVRHYNLIFDDSGVLDEEARLINVRAHWQLQFRPERQWQTTITITIIVELVKRDDDGFQNRAKSEAIQ